MNAQVDLRITCTKNYPDVEPKIKLERCKGMSDALLLELQRALEEKTKILKGEVMIFELAQHVQAFLHEHNKPATKSFYEEMLDRQKQNEQLKIQAQNLEVSTLKNIKFHSKIHLNSSIFNNLTVDIICFIQPIRLDSLPLL